MRQSKMKKSDLVDIVSQDSYIKELDLSQKEISSLISTFIDKLVESIGNLDNKERIELRGFGTFGIKQRKARIGRNPKTGDSVKVPARNSVYFKAGREMKANVKGRK